MPANCCNPNGRPDGKFKGSVGTVPDGLSKPGLVSELLLSPDLGSSHDIRGRVWNSIHAGSTFTTLYPPNSTVGDNAMGYCNPLPAAPCGSQSVDGAFVLARSKHSGGVNVCLGDGSVRFVRNSVNPAAWLAMGSRNGGEVHTDN